MTIVALLKGPNAKLMVAILTIIAILRVFSASREGVSEFLNNFVGIQHMRLSFSNSLQGHTVWNRTTGESSFKA